MALVLRPIEPFDLPEAGRICHEAFTAIAAEHEYLVNLQGIPPGIAIPGCDPRGAYLPSVVY
jgi:hypothetical protein